MKIQNLKSPLLQTSVNTSEIQKKATSTEKGQMFLQPFFGEVLCIPGLKDLAKVKFHLNADK